MPWRTINVNGETYRWKGRHHFVIQNSEGKRVSDPHLTGAMLKGWSEHEWERVCWKGYGGVTPYDIRSYITRNAAIERALKEGE